MPARYEFFLLTDPATTVFYTLSLHDALPIFAAEEGVPILPRGAGTSQCGQTVARALVVDDSKFVNRDRKSTRLNSSHANISYAVFCLKKKTGASNCS